MHYCMEVTRDYISELLVKVDTLFREGIDSSLDTSNSSVYTIKPVADLSGSESYDSIWQTERHLSASQLTDILFDNRAKFNFWDLQLLKVHSSSMCIIVFLNYYREQTGLSIHCAFPSFYSADSGSGGKSIYRIVKTVIDDLDLYGILEGGAPADEFDRESREIANRISKNRTPHQIAGVIADVFNKAFDLHAQDDEFTEPASRIWALLQSRDSENGNHLVS